MTTFNLTTQITAAAAFALVAGAMMFGSVGKAEASNIFDCRAETRTKALKCCNEWVRRHDDKRPMWMLESRSNCESAVKCVGGRVRPIGVAALVITPRLRCYVYNTFNPSNNSGGDGVIRRLRGNIQFN
jgi:hypothetical protein